MRYRVILAAAMASVFAAGVVGQSVKDHHEISPDSAWWITDSTCAINTAWDDETTVEVTIHNDHLDLAIYSPRFKSVVNDKIVRVKIGAGEGAAAAKSYDVNGIRDGSWLGYVASVQDDLLDRVGESEHLQLYRNGALLSEQNMAGFKGALARLRTCQATLSEAMDAANAMDMNVSDESMEAMQMAENAAEAAMNAASAPN